MTDQTLGFPSRKGRLARLRAFAAALLDRTELRPRSAWAISGLIIAVLGRYFWIDEGFLANILFTAAVTLHYRLRGASSRPRVLSTCDRIDCFGHRGRRLVQAGGHEQVSTPTTSSSIWLLVDGYLPLERHRPLFSHLPRCVMSRLGGAPRLPPDSTPFHVPSALAFLAFVGLSWYGAYAKGERRHMQFYYENLYVSSFYASWGETLETLWRGAIMEAAPRAAAGGPGFLIPTSCVPAAKPPHIILIHRSRWCSPHCFRRSGTIARSTLLPSYERPPLPLRVETTAAPRGYGISILAGFDAFLRRHAQFVQDVHADKLKIRCRRRGALRLRNVCSTR